MKEFLIRLYKLLRANFYHYRYRLFPKNDPPKIKFAKPTETYFVSSEPLTDEQRDAFAQIARAQMQCSPEVLNRLRLQNSAADQNLSRFLDQRLRQQQSSQDSSLLSGLLDSSLRSILPPFL